MERKYRWSITGLNQLGQTVVEEAIGQTNFPGNSFSISFTQFFTMYDYPGSAGPAFRSVNSRIKEVSQVLVKRYDGCGQIVEQWKLGNALMVLDPDSDASSEDDIIARWFIFYDTCVKEPPAPRPEFNVNLMYHI